MRRNWTTILLLLGALSFGCATHPIDDSAQMLRSVQMRDSKFPDGKQLKLTQFAYIGTVISNDQELKVASIRAVIPDMPSPRGQAYLSFFNSNNEFVGRYDINGLAPPLWCEGSRIYFFGLQTNGENQGNALDVSKGVSAGHYVLIPAAGSWMPSLEVRTIDTTAEPFQPDSLRDSLSHAPSVARYITSIKSNWTFIEDLKTHEYVILAVGENLPDHFTRGLTVKVNKKGEVFVQSTDKDGEETWIKDVPPQEPQRTK